MRLSHFIIAGSALAALSSSPAVAQSDDDRPMTQADFDAEMRKVQADLEKIKQGIAAAPPEAFDQSLAAKRNVQLKAEAKEAQADLDQMVEKMKDPYAAMGDVTLPSGKVVSAKRYLNQILQGIPAEGTLILPAPLKTSGGKGSLTLKPYMDVLGSTQLVARQVKLENSEIIFGGVGSDRGGESALDNMDLRGKTVILWQDYRAAHRWKVAAERGAAAIFLIVSKERAAEKWDVARSAWGMAHQGASQDPASSDTNTKIVGILSNEGARKIFANAGMDFDASLAAAEQSGFKPVPLNMKASMTLELRDADEVDPDTWKP